MEFINSFIIIFKLRFKIYLYLYMLCLLQFGDWGLGDWGLGLGPNPQSPIPNPQDKEILN